MVDIDNLDEINVSLYMLSDTVEVVPRKEYGLHQLKLIDTKLVKLDASGQHNEDRKSTRLNSSHD